LTEVRGRPLRRSCQCVGLSRAAWYRPPLDWTVRDAPLIAALAIARAGCRSPWLTVGRPTSQGFADALSDAGLALRHDLTVFGQQAPQAIDLRCAELDQLAAHAVQRQDRLLFLGLDRDSFDIRLLNRRPDRVGIVPVVLVAGDKRFHRFARQQLDLMPLRREFPCQCCAPPQASMPMRHACRLAKCSRNFSRLSCKLTISPVSLSIQCN